MIQIAFDILFLNYEIEYVLVEFQVFFGHFSKWKYQP